MPLTFQAEPLTMGWCLDCHRNPGPHLRPPDAIYDPGWPSPTSDPKKQQQLIADYLISTKHLTDCSTCHR